MWCHLPTIIGRRFSLRYVALASLFVALITTLIFSHATSATAGINQTINFQGRLLNAQGAVVPDGYYNIQFKIYQDGDGQHANDSTGSPAGSLKWTETYINNGGTSGVLVKNGFLSVNLGSKTPFGASINWNWDTLWLSMNVAGSDPGCTTYGSGTCPADGEMLPMKQMTASPYALNAQSANTLGGTLTAGNFVQLAQGVQTDASTNTSSIFINKTSTGNLLELQNTANDVFTVGNAGDLTLGNNANHTLSVATSGAGVAGKSLTVSGGAGGSGTGNTGGDLVLQGGAGGGTNGNSGNITIDAGAKTGTGTSGVVNLGTTSASAVNVGTASTATIQIGNTSISSGTQNINVGNNNGAGSTNVVVGSGSQTASGLASGTTAIQSKANTTISTNGVQRATFDTSGNLYVGNGTSNVSPAAFTIQGTGSSTTGVAGGAVTIQGGGTTTGNANGGNLTLSGGSGIGTGVNGLVVLTTPTFQSSGAVQTCSGSTGSMTISQTSVDGNSVIPIASTSSASCVITLPNPTITTAGRVVYVTADATSTSSFTLSYNGGGTGNSVAMRAYTTATMIWNGSAWTAAGASASTTLQAAYDNTIQGSGGAELIVSKTSNTNGLTIRDSSANSVNGALLQIQSKTAANLFSVSSNVSDYASDNGAETAGGSSSTFPASTWTATGSAAVSRNTTTTNNTIATGQASVGITTSTSANSGAANQLVDPTSGAVTALTANTQYNVSLAARLPSGAGIFNNLTVLYQYDGTATHTVTCTSNQSVAQTSWTKINCSFIAPSSGITNANVIRIEQASSGTAHTFYVDNLSVTIAAGQNYATDGGVDSALGTNWVAVGGSATQTLSNGYDKSDSAQITTTAAATSGIKNKLSVNPIASTASTTNLYHISVEVQTQATALTNFTIQYAYDGATMTNCVDYNTQAVSVSSTQWTQITCTIQTPTNAPTSPYIFFTQGDTTVRTSSLYIDTFSMTLANSTTPDVQIGSGTSGGPVTLFTLDSAASAPIAPNNAALYGSMYYDTTQGKIQCYQATGWGSCGAAPDNIVTISPEYTNAVMHGTGVGTMTSDLCSGSLGINDGSSSQPTICAAGETYNFYKWTSPQATSQTYNIYVTYQLPGTFKSFTSGTTSVVGRVDNTTNATVQYQIYLNNNSTLTPCGGAVTVTTSANTWQTATATGTADPSTCGFSAGNSIVFKISVSSNSNGNAYVGNLGFTFSNR